MGDPVYNHLKSVAKARNLNEIEFMAAMQDYMKAVRVHESGNIYTKIQDVETSPGVLEEVGVARGAYQYEMDAGRKKGAPGTTYGAATALRSTKNLFKELGDVPNWINTLIVKYQKEGDIDFSEIEPWQQDIIFISDKARSNKVELQEIINAFKLGSDDRKKEYAKIWGKSHKKSADYKKDLTKEGYLRQDTNIKKDTDTSSLIDGWNKEDNIFA